MGLLKLPIYDGVPSASFFEPGCFAVVDETPEPEDGQPEPSERKLAIWVGDEDGVPRQAGGGFDEPALIEFLAGHLPQEPGEGIGAVIFGRTSQRGSARGNGALCAARQGTSDGNFSLNAGLRNHITSGGVYAVAFGGELNVSRVAQFARGFAHPDNEIINQWSAIAQSGVTRDGTPTQIRHYAAERTPFSLEAGQYYATVIDVNAIAAGGAERVTFRLELCVQLSHAGEPSIVGQVDKRRLYSDAAAWDVEPTIVTRTTDNGENHSLELMAAGEDGKQIIWTADIKWHETTLPFPPPPAPQVLSSEAGDAQTVHTFAPVEDLPSYDGRLAKYTAFRRVGAGQWSRIETFNPTETWTDDGDEVYGAIEEGVDLYYQFAIANRYDILSARTDVIGPLTPSA